MKAVSFAKTTGKSLPAYVLKCGKRILLKGVSFNVCLPRGWASGPTISPATLNAGWEMMGIGPDKAWRRRRDFQCFFQALLNKQLAQCWLTSPAARGEHLVSPEWLISLAPEQGCSMTSPSYVAAAAAFFYFKANISSSADTNDQN